MEDTIAIAGAVAPDSSVLADAPTTPAGTDAARHPAALAAALAASAAALAACGGGGGGGGGGAALTAGAIGAGATTAAQGPSSTAATAGSLTPLNSTPAAATYAYTEAKTDAEAARFLLQAQFSASPEEIAAVRSKGYLVWLAEQFDAPATETGWSWVDGMGYNTVEVDRMMWKQLITSGDALRKRVALALSEIFVVSANELGSSWPTHMIAHYWDLLVAGAGGSYRKLLEDVALNPAMGFYLNTRGNQKENAQGRQPDENFAREVMQLMTVGLYQVNADGTVRKDASGNPLYTYTQDDVTNLARVFTGYDLDIADSERNGFTPPGAGYSIETNAWTRRPMVATASGHSTLAATFLGVTVPANTTAAASLKTALDTLANHANVGPFIGIQLIQRMVTSNPSAAYVKRVAEVFADNGAGVRGDLKSVVAAVLLDNEARGPLGLTDPAYGHVREPMLRLVHWARTFGVTSKDGSWKIGNLSNPANQLGQSPLRSSSVFNFFRPGYVPPSTAIAAGGLVAPEFQLVNETSVGGYLNFMQNILQYGFNSQDVMASYAVEKTLVTDADALVTRIALLLTANQLSAANKALIVGALATPAVTGTSSDLVKLSRICAAILLVMASSEYLVQK